MSNKPSGKLAALAVAVSSLAACGGSPGGGEAAPGAAAGGSIEGQSFKGPLHGATLCVYAIDNAAPDRKGAAVPAQSGSLPAVADGCVVTGSDGSYRFELPAAIAGDLLVESTGGTYCSDESIFNGSGCADAGAPVAMGAHALHTVVTTPGAGKVRSAPLTLLTTSAVRRTGELNATGFEASYATVASQLGLTGATTSDAPASGALATLLASLSRHLGPDNRLIPGLVERIADGTLTGDSGGLRPVEVITAWALNSSERRYVRLSSGCFSLPGGGYREHVYGLFLPEGRSTMGTIDILDYADASCNVPVDDFSASFEVEYLGPIDVPLQATTDVLKAQTGSASTARFTFPADSRLGDLSGLDANFMIARTSDACHSSARAYLSAPDSPVKDGVLSRLDVSKAYAIFCEN